MVSWVGRYGRYIVTYTTFDSSDRLIETLISEAQALRNMLCRMREGSMSLYGT
jgi:hypothetical protein